MHFKTGLRQQTLELKKCLKFTGFFKSLFLAKTRWYKMKTLEPNNKHSRKYLIIRKSPNKHSMSLCWQSQRSGWLNSDPDVREVGSWQKVTSCNPQTIWQETWRRKIRRQRKKENKHTTEVIKNIIKQTISAEAVRAAGLGGKNADYLFQCHSPSVNS